MVRSTAEGEGLESGVLFTTTQVMAYQYDAANRLTGAGEPGRNDLVEIVVKNANGQVVLSISSTLQPGGNHQAFRMP